MRDATFGPLRVRLAGGSDREGGGDGPLVVLLHGYGAPGTDLVPLWREIVVPQGTRFAFPEAPLELELGLPPELGPARAWWQIDVERFVRTAQSGGDFTPLTREVPEGLAEARAQLIQTLGALSSALGVDDSRIVLGGFSQGAMLALDLALDTGRSFAGLILMSGTLIAADAWRAAMPKQRGMRVLQSHGRADPLLPFSVAEQLRDALVGAGLEVRFIGFNGGHEIAGSVLDALGHFLGEVLPDGSPQT